MNKNRHKSVTATLLGVILFIPLIAPAYEPWPGIPEITVEIRKEKSVFVPMRDGVRLSTDLYTRTYEGRPRVLQPPGNKRGRLRSVCDRNAQRRIGLFVATAG